MGALDGRTALVTGASKGIGAAIARVLASEGAHVGVLARSAAAVRQVAASRRRDGAGRRRDRRVAARVGAAAVRRG